jgi:hypothetical protein
LIPGAVYSETGENEHPTGGGLVIIFVDSDDYDNRIDVYFCSTALFFTSKS